MKPRRISAFAFVLALVVLSACGHKEEKHGKEEKGEGHGHEEEAPSGASFKPSKGIILTDETRKILGIEVADIVERKLPNEVQFNLQVFGQKHHHTLGDLDHTGCDVHGSGFVPTNALSLVSTGQLVQILKAPGVALTGVVLNVTKALAIGDAEIVVGVSNAATELKAGDFVAGKITVQRNEAVSVVPKAAVLRTSEGTFVYTVNGAAFFRTAVKTGAEANDLVEITDGLLAGDQVVTKSVETLWLIELRATKGGGHSH